MVLERIPVAEMVTSPTKIDESTGGYHHVSKLCQSTFYVFFTSAKHVGIRGPHMDQKIIKINNWEKNGEMGKLGQDRLEVRWEAAMFLFNLVI